MDLLLCVKFMWQARAVPVSWVKICLDALKCAHFDLSFVPQKVSHRGVSGTSIGAMYGFSPEGTAGKGELFFIFGFLSTRSPKACNISTNSLCAACAYNRSLTSQCQIVHSNHLFLYGCRNLVSGYTWCIWLKLSHVVLALPMHTVCAWVVLSAPVQKKDIFWLGEKTFFSLANKIHVFSGLSN